MSDEADQRDPYERLCDRYERVAMLGKFGGAGGVLSWDQQVMMPEGGTPARAKQLSTLSAVRHDYLTDDEFGALVEECETADLDEEERAAVREIRHEYERAAEVPESLVEELSATRASATEAWEDAKAADDFDAFAPTLAELRDLNVERAGHVAPAKPPYQVLHEDNERDIPLETVEDIFDTLREELVPLVEAIRERGDDPPAPFVEAGPYDEADQMALNEAVCDLLGYDWDRGRLDAAPHPFTSGNQFDCRITTRFREDDLLDALTATVHEFGHATYQLGLPEEQFAHPLGEARSSGVHESQSRFWENHVGRTEAFWELFLPRVKEQFPRLEDVTPREAYAAANRIYPENCIRVEADELTYHFHVMLRYEIGRAFVAGDLDVEEIPRVWNDKMEAYLGVRPETDAEGCLQDIHWSDRFAAFQGYTIGSVLAAQLDAAMRRDLDADVDQLVREGEFDPLREWMTEHVHRHGKRYPADQLVAEATGEPLTAEYFVDYAREKFTELYGL